MCFTDYGKALNCISNVNYRMCLGKLNPITFHCPYAKPIHRSGNLWNKLAPDRQTSETEWYAPPYLLCILREARLEENKYGLEIPDH